MIIVDCFMMIIIMFAKKNMPFFSIHRWKAIICIVLKHQTTFKNWGVGRGEENENLVFCSWVTSNDKVVNHNDLAMFKTKTKKRGGFVSFF